MIIDRHAQLKALHLHGMAAAWQEWQVKEIHDKNLLCLKSG